MLMAPASTAPRQDANRAADATASGRVCIIDEASPSDISLALREEMLLFNVFTVFGLAAAHATHCCIHMLYVGCCRAEKECDHQGRASQRRSRDKTRQYETL